MTDRRPRRLAAILMLDIVGFSRMMGRDDEATTERVVRFHGDVATLCTAHGGRVVDTAGDSVFGEFDSIVEALECAATIQERLAKDESPDRIMARIGLHFGDVLVHGDDLYGDGVNIASRLEQLAPPGGIAVSEVVHQEVGGRLPFRDAGQHTLKNIERRIRVYVVPPEHFGFPPAPVAADSDGEMIVAGSEAVRDIAALVRERIADKRAGRQLPPLDERLERMARRIDEPAVEEPRTLRALLTSGGFWLMLTIGALLTWSRPGGWTTNAVYPALGAILVGSAVGGVLKVITHRRGMRALGFAVAMGLSGWLYFTGPVSRAVVWAVGAAALGPALSGMRRDA